jgi:hypothetical protein
MRRVSPEERPSLLPALWYHYATGTRGLFDSTSFSRRILTGDLYTISVDDDGRSREVAAIFFDCDADSLMVHVVRWGAIDHSLFVEAALRILDRAFEVHQVGTIRAEIPISNRGAIRLAEECGMEKVGRIPRGLRLPSGGFSDTFYYILTPRGDNGG